MAGIAKITNYIVNRDIESPPVKEKVDNAEGGGQLDTAPAEPNDWDVLQLFLSILLVLFSIKALIPMKYRLVEMRPTVFWCGWSQSFLKEATKRDVRKLFSYFRVLLVYKRLCGP
jgi:hypothetical protein